MAPVETLKYPNITIQLTPRYSFQDPFSRLQAALPAVFWAFCVNEKVPQEATIILGTVSD